MQRISVIGGTGMKQLVAEAYFGDSGFTISQDIYCNHRFPLLTSKNDSQ